MSRICIYFKPPAEKDRFIKGDRYIRPLIRYLIRGKQIGGIEKVYLNLCRGFDKIGTVYTKNLSFKKIKPDDKIIVLGAGKDCLKGYHANNTIIAGIGLMTHPFEWPDLFQQYPVKVYLQPSQWTFNIYKKYYNSCDIWPCGIETEKWKPTLDKKNKFDILIYNKIRWEKDSIYSVLKNPISDFLNRKEISFKEIIYGHYTEKEYHKLLRQCKAMIFLCEHESQGIAYQEAMSMNVPIMAWDQGRWLDPNRFLWGEDNVAATSVPYFDSRCGMKFTDIENFKKKFENFWECVLNNKFKPRKYILENLTLEKSAQRMLDIVEKWK